MGFLSMNPERFFKTTPSTIMMSSQYTDIYTHVVATRDLNSYKAGLFTVDTLFDRIELRMRAREIWVKPRGTEDLIMVLNVVPATCIGATRRSVENELLCFMRRGHSLRTENCRCATEMSSSRSMDLGLSRDRVVQDCTLHSVKAFMISDIQQELGVTSLADVLVGDCTILDVLTKSVFFSEEADMWGLSSACRVSNRESLLIYVRMSRLGVNIDNAMIAYPQLNKDIAALREEGLVLVLDCINGSERGTLASRAGAPGKFRIFPSTIAGVRCDDDIVAMWKSAAPRRF